MRSVMYLLFGAMIGWAVPATANEPIEVDMPAGAVRGELADGIAVFRGIPYAAPPVGERRWRPPGPLPRWSDVRDASEFGPSCFQPMARAEASSIYADDVGPMSEDCLTLNIWAPEDATDAPVFVWIHGGALVSGSSRFSMYDGRHLAEQGLVVVSINYRLGVLGWLAHPALSAEQANGVSGNYGLLDQIAALQWIEGNIAAFGGNPDQVTIAGESAGALSVTYLMASPRARSLFDRAIAQSAYLISTPHLREERFGQPSAEAVGSWLQAQLGAEDLAALRAMDAGELANAALRAGYLAWGTIDGDVLPRELVDVFDAGEQAPVPVLAGFNQGEIRSLRRLLPPAPEAETAYREAIARGYGDLAADVLRFYPPGNIDEAMLATLRDAMYGWTAERLAASQAERGQPSFLYLFDHSTPATDNAGLHAFHASEIPYMFGTIGQVTESWPAIPDMALERDLSSAMVGYWASFARGEVPVAEGQPDWTPYAEGQAFMHFAEVPRPSHDVFPGHFELHEQVMCRRRAGGVAWNWNAGIAAPPLPPQISACQ